MRKLTFSLLLGLCVIFLATTSLSLAEDSVINGCVNKKGVLRVVNDPSKCWQWERPISWSQAGPQGPQGKKGLQGRQGEPGVGGIQVYDYNYQYIGALAGMESFGEPILRIYVFNPKLKKFAIIAGTRVLMNGIRYEGENCTGASYMSFNSDYFNTIKFDAGHRFFTGGALLKENYTIMGGSYLGDDGICRNRPQNSGDSGNWYEVVEIPAGDAPFTLPLALPFHFE